MMGLELLLGLPGTRAADELLQIFSEYSTIEHDEGVRYVVPTPSHVYHLNEFILSRPDFPGLLGDPVRSWNDFLLEIIAPTDAIRRISRAEYDMILDQLLSECSETVFARISRFPGFGAALLGTLRSLREAFITAEDIRGCASGIEPTLAERLLHLAALHDTYEARVSGSDSCDDEKMATLCVKAVEEKSFAGYKCLIFDGFSALSPRNTRALRDVVMAASRESRVVVSLEFDPRHPDKYPATRPLFETLTAIPGAQSRVVARDDARKAGIRYIANAIFESDSCRGTSDESILVLSASDRQAEVEHVATEILRLLSKGVSPREIAVSALDPDTYRDSFFASCRRHGVLVAGESAPLLRNGLAHTIRLALRVAREGWSEKLVAAALRSRYLDCSPEECSRIIRLARTEKPRDREAWFGRWSDDDLSDVRMRSLAPICALEDHLCAVESADDLLSAVGEFAKELRTGDDPERLAADSAAWKAIQSMIAEVSIDSPAGSRSAVDGLIARLHDGRYSMQLTSGDGVQFLPLAQMAGTRFKNLFVLGMLQKQAGSALPLLRDFEIETLKSRCPSLKTASEEQRIDRFFFLAAISRVTEKVYLSYPASDSSGTNSTPSSFLTEIDGLLSSLPVKKWKDYFCAVL
jgi:ATP-dependent helicase/DNAse subunit B